MEELCDDILRENSSRAVLDEAPVSFKEAKDKWRDHMEQHTSSEKKNQNPQKTDSGTGKFKRDGFLSNTDKKKNFSTNSDSKRSGFQARAKPVLFNGNPVCYHFNDPTTNCRRNISDGNIGCDNGKGGFFAHVCNFLTSPGVYCFGRHERGQFHKWVIHTVKQS